MAPDLLALAERCEQATGPNIDLDLAISEATKAWKALPTWRQFRPTASLDAAMQLVPEGSCWRVIAWPKNTRGFKAGALVEGAPDAGGSTPALALCAAALRARAAASPNLRVQKG